MKPLNMWRILAYGLPYIAFSCAQIPIAIFLPSFYSSDLGVPLALTGLIIAVTRITDVITDPLVGVLSDKTRSPFGRRKPYIAIGAPLLMLSAWMLYAPPEGAGALHLAIWIFVIYLAFTFIDIPMKAWGAELSKDYRQRTIISGVREVLGSIGLLTALGMAAYLTMSKKGGNPEAMRWIAYAVVFSTPVLFTLMLWLVPEPAPDGYERASKMNWRQGLKVILRNGPFVRLAICSLAITTSIYISATLNQFFVTQVLGQPEIFAPALAGSLLLSIACTPVWIWLGNRFGKHKVVALALTFNALSALPFLFLGKGDGAIYVGLLIAGGTSSASAAVLLNAMAADVVDLDVARTGKSRSGLYFSSLGMLTKSSAALGVLISTAIPPMFGFDPRAAEQTSQGLLGLKLAFAIVPSLILLMAVPLLWKFPLTAARQARIRAGIDRRAALRPVTAPDSP